MQGDMRTGVRGNLVQGEEPQQIFSRFRSLGTHHESQCIWHHVQASKCECQKKLKLSHASAQSAHAGWAGWGRRGQQAPHACHQSVQRAGSAFTAPARSQRLHGRPCRKQRLQCCCAELWRKAAATVERERCIQPMRSKPINRGQPCRHLMPAALGRRQVLGCDRRRAEPLHCWLLWQAQRSALRCPQRC